MGKDNLKQSGEFEDLKRNVDKDNLKEVKKQNKVKIIESPRDAMQGIKQFIPTAKKAKYINALLKVGFATLDFGSFVSPKAIPQLKDTAEVLSKLDLSATETKLLVIVGNERGCNDAVQYDEISSIGFPFSISETFLKNNLNSSIEKSKATVDSLLNICDKKKKDLVVYMSMAFGNPYGDEWNTDIVASWVYLLNKMGVRIIPLSDTVGIAKKMVIADMFSTLVPAFPEIEFGFHMHTSIRHWYRKVDAAFMNGCRRFDTTIKGLGGCPMSGEPLVGNLKTSNLFEYLESKDVPLNINEEAFIKAFLAANKTFPPEMNMYSGL